MRQIYDFVAPLLANTLKQHNDSYRYLSMLPDRFAVRRNDQQVGSETWHKDRSMQLDQAENSFLLGGWINLDKHIDQYFSCIPGDYPLFHQTYQYYRSQPPKGGFQGEVNANTREKQTIIIPPYHMIIFNELITHEVVKGPTKRTYDDTKNSYRCYLKWYISQVPEPYWPKERFDNFIEDQTQIGMSYFQEDAPMYASAHTSTGIPILQRFSQQFRDEVKNFRFKDQQKYPGVYVDRFIGKEKNKDRRKGLKDWGLAFPPYEPYDKEIYIPKRI